MRLPQAPANSLPTPFQIGIRPLELSEWIDVDGLLGSYLDEKARLWATERAAVFAAEADTPAALTLSRPGRRACSPNAKPCSRGSQG
jgi:hypothetical protein